VQFAVDTTRRNCVFAVLAAEGSASRGEVVGSGAGAGGGNLPAIPWEALLPMFVWPMPSQCQEDPERG